jgi:hypothetical protein
MAIRVGLVGPKARTKVVVDGHPVNIPEPEVFRQHKATEVFFPASSDSSECAKKKMEVGE